MLTQLFIFEGLTGDTVSNKKKTDSKNTQRYIATMRVPEGILPLSILIEFGDN